MASTRIPRPPDWLLKADLMVSPVIAAMLFVLTVLCFERGEYLTGLRSLALGLACLGGSLYSLKLYRARRRARRSN